MNLQELVTKVTEDKAETPYITLDDIKGVSDELSEKETQIKNLTEENTNIKEELDKKKTEYDLLKSRIVDSVLSGKDLKLSPNLQQKQDDNKRDTLTFADLIKK